MTNTQPTSQREETPIYIVVLKFWDGRAYTSDDSDARAFFSKDDAEKYMSEMSHGAGSDHLIVTSEIDLSPAKSQWQQEVRAELNERYGQDGKPALVVIEGFDGHVEQRPALSEILSIPSLTRKEDQK